MGEQGGADGGEEHSVIVSDTSETVSAGARLDESAVVLVCDVAGHVRSAGPAVERVLAIDPASLVGSDVATLVDPHDRDRFGVALDQARSTLGESARLAMRLLDRASRPIWVDATLVLRGTGAGAEVVVTARPYQARTRHPSGGGGPAEADRYHALVHSSADIVMVVDPDGTVRFANTSLLGTLGMAPSELLGSQVLELFHPGDHEMITDAVIGLLEEPGRSIRIEMRARHADGTWRWIEGYLQNLLDHPDVGGLLGNGRDITDRRRAEAALRASEARFRTLAASSPSAIFELDADGRLTYANERWAEIMGAEAVMAADVWNVVHAEDVDDLLADWQEGGWREGIQTRVRVVRPDGTHRWVQAHTLPLWSEEGIVEGHVGTLHDVTDVQRYEAELAHQARHDPLTQLPNRAHLVDHIEQALAGARAGGGLVAVLFVDLDRFKVVNDSLGHHAGDQLLTTVALRLAHTVRPGDLVTRFGGDEFVVVCEGIASEAEAVDVADRVQDAVSGPAELGDTTVHVSASTGVVVTDGSVTAGDLLRDADAAMYAAKERGRARAAVFDHELRRAAVERLETEQALRLALERDELVVHYQPIVSLDGGALAGAEALVRWRHPTEGLVGPDRFLGVAEESGLVRDIGAWVLDRACGDAVAWPPDAAGRPLELFVNLSGAQLADRSIVDDVAGVLAATGLAPGRLHVEVTEGAVMGVAGEAARVLDELRGIGVRIAVDDFGTGYSSLSHLSRLPLDLLKVDRTFVAGIGSHPADEEVIAAIVALAHALGLRTVAEGVETEEQLEVLRRLGCGWAQGFWFSPPVPAEDLAALL